MSRRILFKVCLPLIAAPLLSIFTAPETIAASQNQQKLWLEPGISGNTHNSLLISRDDRDRYRDTRQRRREIRRDIRRLEREERRLRDRRGYDRDRYYRQRVYDRDYRDRDYRDRDYRDRDYDRRYPAYPIRRGY